MRAVLVAATFAFMLLSPHPAAGQAPTTKPEAGTIDGAKTGSRLKKATKPASVTKTGSDAMKGGSADAACEACKRKVDAAVTTIETCKVAALNSAKQQSAHEKHPWETKAAAVLEKLSGDQVQKVCKKATATDDAKKMAIREACVEDFKACPATTPCPVGIKEIVKKAVKKPALGAKKQQSRRRLLGSRRRERLRALHARHSLATSSSHAISLDSETRHQMINKRNSCRRSRPESGASSLQPDEDDLPEPAAPRTELSYQSTESLDGGIGPGTGILFDNAPGTNAHTMDHEIAQMVSTAHDGQTRSLLLPVPVA